MNVDDIVKLVNMGVNLLQIGVSAVNEISSSLSETDQAKIDQALADARAATAIIRPQVDDALNQASDVGTENGQ